MEGDPPTEWQHFDDAWWWAGEQCPARYAVVDTNMLLEHFETIQRVLAQMPGMNFVVPCIVLEELEALDSLGLEAAQAKHALYCLRAQLELSGGVRCECSSQASALVLQELYEANANLAMMNCSSVGDGVLSCALYFSEVAPGMTQVLTSDRKMSIRASAHAIPSECVEDLLTRSLAMVSNSEVAGVFESLNDLSAEASQPWMAATISTSELDGCIMTAAPLNYDHVVSEGLRSSGMDCVHPPPGLLLPAEQDNALFDVELPPQEKAKQLEVLELECRDSIDSGVVSTEEGVTEDEDMSESELPTSVVRFDGNKLRVPQLVLRGLPFTITMVGVCKFLTKMGVRNTDLADHDAVVLLNQNGRATGFAEIHLAPGADVKRVKHSLHMQYLGERYVEALPPTPAHMRDGNHQKMCAWKLVNHTKKQHGKLRSGEAR